MRQVILDTDMLSEYLKGHDATVAARAGAYARQHGIFTFTSVTVYEILYGLEVKGAAQQRSKALAWIQQNEKSYRPPLITEWPPRLRQSPRRKALLSNCPTV